MILLLLYVIYAILIFILFRFTKSLITENKKGIIEFCLIISLLFPIIGLIVSVIMLLLNIKRSKTEWLQQYSDYLSFQVDNYEDILESSKQDLDLISFSSGLELDKPELHKQLIVQLSSSSISNEGGLLKEAIHHKDPETVHYAATTINLLNERYEKQIEYLNKQFLQNPQHEIAQELVSNYLRYIDSGLLSNQQKEKIIDDFIHFITQSVELFPKESLYSFQLGNLFLYKKQYARSEEQFSNLINFYPESYYGYVGLLETYYEQKLWDKLYDLINNLTDTKRIHMLPRKYQLFVGQFGGVHIEKGD
ncbi:tetratricopeptide repeat protein [Bacillus paramycoides]|uniref:tetratricopeptide repeat protein n=1 Tax=Bacillus paramycoides TaxID=2026194 RepID=UPI0037FA7A6A